MTTISLEQIGKNVARYRKALGLTQSDLAEKVTVSTAFISRVERGQKMMKVQTLYAVSQALGVSCDALLHDDNTETHLGNIQMLLSEQPSEYLIGIEKVIRACIQEFKPKDNQTTSPKKN